MGKIMLESPEDVILQKDLELAAYSDISIEMLAGSRVFITGATGLIGSQMVKFLLCCNRLRGTDIQVIANVRSEEKARRILGHLLENNNLSLWIGDINIPISYAGKVDYVVHGASATSSRFFVEHPVETIMTAIVGTNNVLSFAKEKSVSGMVYLSSLEVYGTLDKQDGFISEDAYGYIEPLNVRSSYSEGKRMVECLCASYAKQYDVPIKIARLSQTFGAGVAYDDGRVFAEFARCVIEKKDIVLNTAGRTVRSYCYTKDAITALLTVLIKGSAGEAYNVTNMNTAISIYDMAQLVCDVFPDAKISVRREIPDDATSFGYNPEMIIKLDSNKLENLGWKPTVDLKEMFERMIKSIKERI